jgi:hypothetical protein
MNDATLHNALNSAEVFLARMNVEPDAVVVVTASPHTSIGLWRPGFAMVKRLPMIDDAGIEVLEAAAPAVQDALERIEKASLIATLEAMTRGARLQLLIAPATGCLALRADDGTHAVELVSISLERITH